MGGVGKPSERVLRALAGFGLTADEVVRGRGELVGAARCAAGRVLDAARAGTITLVTGGSGCGKSTLLAAVAEEGRRAGGVVVDARAELRRAVASRARVVELLDGPLEGEGGVLRALSAAGLADARVGAQRARELSEGQRARLGVALAVWRAREGIEASRQRGLEGGREEGVGGGAGTECRGTQRRGTQSRIALVDEFCSTLDEATARGVCLSLRRWATRGARAGDSCPALVLATARGQVEGWLSPDVVVDASRLGVGDGEGLLSVRDGCGCAGRGCDEPEYGGLEIREGRIEDYLSLAHHHYRAGAPATVAKVLVARERGASAGGGVLGVLVVSMPTLNGAWRAMAWPREYGGERGAAARRLNAEVRCVSRVVVRPEARGRGVGAALVRAYLARPLTRRTEAVAAMGAASPMFVRAGMAEWTPPRSERDERLLAALGAAGLMGWDLVWTAGVVEAAEKFAHLEGALRAWARASRSTRVVAGAGIEEIVRAAARRVPVRARAYTFG